MKEDNELLASAKLTSKGQITIPKIVRETLNIEENFYNYINGYSDEVKDIIKNFDLNKQIEKMTRNGILYPVIDTFNFEKARFIMGNHG